MAAPVVAFAKALGPAWSMYAIVLDGFQEPWAGKPLAPCASPGKPLLPGMAVLAVHLLPRLTDLGRMLEFQAGHSERCGARIRALIEDGVTEVAILREDFPRSTHMFPVVTTEATQVSHVPNVVGIDFRADAHVRKEIPAVLPFEFFSGCLDQVALLRGYLGILLLIELPKRGGDT